MPRLTPKQLVEVRAKRREEASRMAKQRIVEEAAERDRQVQRIQRLFDDEKRHELLSGVAKALYDEVDKLTKKAPTASVSTLTTDKSNRIIRSVRELTATYPDDFSSDIVEFVAAGDLPEYRDVLLTLREVTEALDRVRSEIRRRKSVEREKAGLRHNELLEDLLKELTS